MSNGSPTMKGTKNPGKLNTSFWQTAFKDGDGNKPKGKSSKKKGSRKKRKSKMTAMWEDKFEKEKKVVESTTYIKPTPKPKPKPDTTTPPITKSDEPNVDNNNNTDTIEDDNNTDIIINNDNNIDTITNNDVDTIDNNNNNTDTSENESKQQKVNKVSALAGKLNINPMGMRGGLPPSLQKKREEQKEDGTELPSQDFARPIIPKSVQRKKATKKDIISIHAAELHASLRGYLSESFMYDECMILQADNLCLYLQDIAGLDLSLISDKKWDFDILRAAIMDVFGDKVENQYGYQLRAI